MALLYGVSSLANTSINEAQWKQFLLGAEIALKAPTCEAVELASELSQEASQLFELAEQFGFSPMAEIGVGSVRQLCSAYWPQRRHYNNEFTIGLHVGGSALVKLLGYDEADIEERQCRYEKAYQSGSIQLCEDLLNHFVESGLCQEIKSFVQVIYDEVKGETPPFTQHELIQKGANLFKNHRDQIKSVFSRFLEEVDEVLPSDPGC